jgi:cyclase
MEANLNRINSKHFRLEQLTTGVYAATHQEGGLAASNAGIIDLGDRTLVFDTFFSPQAATDLRTATEELTGRPIDYVVNSHWHHDHIWGNQVFSRETDIISARETQRLIGTAGKAQVEEFRQTAPGILASWQARLDDAKDVQQRRQCATWVDYFRSCVEAQSILQLRLPNVTFVDHFSLTGTKRSVELLDCGPGHTASDAILFLPEDGIVFMSDLLFVGYQPYLGAGDPDQILRTMERVNRLAADTFVPGHGPVGHSVDLAQMSQYIQTLQALARQMVAAGQPEEEIDGMSIPEPYDDWLYASFFVENMHLLVQRQLQQQPDIG